GVIPDAQPAKDENQSLQPVLDDARARLENIKDVWTEYVAGEPKRLGRFRELLAPLTQKARELGNVPLLHLLLAVNGATAQLPDPYPLDGQAMSLEMASALLMAESIITHFNDLPPDLEQQVAIMRGWLADAVAGKVKTSSPSGLRADIVQKANDEKLRIATAREILKNLQQVEKAVEAYANDPSKRDTLVPLAAILRQVQGVFEVSNQKRAGRLAFACQHLIDRCAKASAADSSRDIEWLAEGLGSLGFYLEPCLHGKEPAERAVNLYFTRYEKQEGLEALLGLSQKLVASVPVETDAVAAPAPAPVPAQPAVDGEMLGVFLEEAHEVLTAMESSITQARNHAGKGDHDALINVRRGFHTLKGSARMVGLSAYGDCAWEMEQAMNHWLAQALPATPELLDLCTDARTLLAEWTHALQGEATPAVDASGIARRARALRGIAPAVDAHSGATTLGRMPAAAPAQPPLQDLQTLNFAATRKVRTDLLPAADEGKAPEAAAATVTTKTAPPVPAEAAQGVAAPNYQQTLADLGDRLTWINGLVEEMRQQSKATANPRLAEIADTLGESMGEALELHRKLRETLAANRP
ncbi:MAG TPA: Hpt domain-containing protein, partial [Burkholderiales bacterium]|nr:Hpt domain-containing protein [Burkholderiales bacterium]